MTDGHGQIDAWLRNTQPEIKHRYDVWHVAKCKAINVIIAYIISESEISCNIPEKVSNWQRRTVVKLLESGCKV